jgi:hypothetical protein
MSSRDTLAVGADVLRGIEQSDTFARECLTYLMSKQEPHEIIAGCTIDLNRRGFNKQHATTFNGTTTIASLSRTRACNIAANYAHTQLAAAIISEELELPILRRQKRPRLVDEDSDGEQEEGEDEDAVSSLLVDHYAVREASLVLPSRAFCDRALLLAQNLSKAAPPGISSKTPPWDPEAVRAMLNKQESWLNVNIDCNTVDAALYFALPRLVLFQEQRWVRVFWAPEKKWATAIVETVSKLSARGGLSLRLHFPDDTPPTSAVLTGADVHYAFALE